MRSFARLSVFIAVAATATAVQAQVTVSNAWVRGTVQGQTATGAFMQLRSADGATLVGADSPAAGIVEIHEMRMEGNTMRMRRVEQLELPAGRAVELKPGGYHVMLMDLKAPLKKGDTVPIKLKVRSKSGQAQDVEVKAEVRDVAAAAGGASKH
jgi:hypothetical protein